MTHRLFKEISFPLDPVLATEMSEVLNVHVYCWPTWTLDPPLTRCPNSGTHKNNFELRNHDEVASTS